jgi:hypothetical protein
LHTTCIKNFIKTNLQIEVQTILEFQVHKKVRGFIWILQQVKGPFKATQ